MALKSTRYQRPEPASLERRGAPRMTVHLTSAALLRSGDVSIEAELHDISVFGCRISVDAIFQEGEEVQVSIDNFEPVVGNVVWQDGRLAGCKFLFPIHPQILRALTIKP